MKKLLSILLVTVLAISFVGCSSANQGTKGETENKENEKPVPTTVEEAFDNISNDDYFYSDASGNTIKILDKDEFAAYVEKADAITRNEMEAKNVNMDNCVVYNYYRNVNGEKSHKNYVVVYDENKAPTSVYAVLMTINENDEPVLKETVEVKEVINDNFKKIFSEELN